MTAARAARLIAVIAIVLTGCAAEQSAPKPVSAEAVAAAAELNSWWSQQAPSLSFAFTPVPAERLSNGADGLTCNGVKVKRKEVADNAFVDADCDEGVLVAFDPDYVGTSPLRLRLTFAHEWGHVVQAQAPDIDASAAGRPILAELQADCFAGAWAQQGLAKSDLAAARDDVGETGDFDDVAIEDDDAHGFPQERIAAFDLGYGGGVGICLRPALERLVDSGGG